MTVLDAKHILEVFVPQLQEERSDQDFAETWGFVCACVCCGPAVWVYACCLVSVCLTPFRTRGIVHFAESLQSAFYKRRLYTPHLLVVSDHADGNTPLLQVCCSGLTGLLGLLHVEWDRHMPHGTCLSQIQH